MEFLENVGVVVSIVSGLASIAMFLSSRMEKNKAKKEKDECIKIKNELNQVLSEQKSKQTNDINGGKNMVSNDNYSINNVKNFDNRKSIK